ncbi:MAG: HTTM domain-containing protein [Acidobacteriaceae bacterium]|nr:HTTM domain-containing protein [Acidobacteriaceae bacterium]
MTLRSLADAWNRFFFEPQLPTPVSLFRILYGCCVVATLLLLRPDWLTWFGVRSWATLATIRQIEPGMRLNLFTVLPQDDRWIAALFWLFLLSATCLTAGFLTRLNTVIVFLCLTSIHQRNLYINHGGDTFLRVAGFFLIFAPAGAAFSIDRLLRIKRGKEGADIEPKSPWAQRMIQFELALLYLTSAWWKSMGEPWVNGTALYYVTQLEEIRRFPIPNWIQHPVILKLGSWYALALESALGTLIWFKEFRYPLLLLGLLFHLCLEYALNIPMFQWDVLSAYVLFIDPADLTRLGNWLRERSPLTRIPLPTKAQT